MARLEFERIDLPIEIRSQASGSVVLRVGRGGLRREYVVGIAERSWNTPDLWQAAPDVANAIAEWLRNANRGVPARFGDRVMLPRIVLRIDDARLASLNWEQGIGTHYWGEELLPFVRASSVRPRAAGLPLTFPIRTLQIGPSSDYLVSQHWERMFRHFGADGLGNAVIAEESPPPALGPTCTYRDWPTIDVLHFDDFLSLALTPEMIWETGNPETPGTLGWLSRIADLNQTRLVVLRALSYDQVAVLQRLAVAVAARGGPGVLVVAAAPPSAYRFIERFYERLVHDHPLDAAFGEARTEYPADGQAMHTLMVGAGREDLLRASSIGLGLMAINIRLADSAPAAAPEWGELEDVAQTSGASWMSSGVVRAELEQLESEWSGYDFADSERDGLIPLSRRVRNLRAAVGVPSPPVRALRPPGPRYVNSSLWVEHPDGQLARIEQRGARLTVGETCHLKLLIGPKDTSVRTVGAAALIEEVFKWTPAMSGVWVEIGVTGLDFEVVGDPVQELWLPKDGAADPVYFAVSPLRKGVARLRFCLYFRNDVVQSFRLAAVTVGPGVPPLTDGQARSLLAQALDLDLEPVRDEGYLARLEYSLADSIDDAPQRAERKLSLVVNHRNEDAVITVKARNSFHVRVNRDVPDRVRQVRRALAEVSAQAIVGVLPEKWPYAFGLDNCGDAKTLKAALQKLAVAGRDLYAAILSQTARDALGELLADPETIHVAHVLLEDVIPWAAIYDRPYDEGRTIDHQEAPVDQDVCLASLPAGAGGMGTPKCGAVGCVLHPESLKQRREGGGHGLIPETVVCPLHFWGFRHIVEVPAQQVKGKGEGRAARDRVESGQLANLFAAINATLDPARTPPERTHGDELDSLLVERAPAPGAWVAKLSDRNGILNALGRTDLDLIFFYCHARGGREHPEIDPPVLEIQVAARPAQGWIKAADLSSGDRWAHHPLVFLNGCGTAGFSPDALSPFITTLVEDRAAAGVVGTEISVREVLAREFARHFLSAFLAGRPAGMALREARQKLLEKNNPLGLVYTLYATADLQLERK